MEQAGGPGCEDDPGDVLFGLPCQRLCAEGIQSELGGRVFQRRDQDGVR